MPLTTPPDPLLIVRGHAISLTTRPCATPHCAVSPPMQPTGVMYTPFDAPATIQLATQMMNMQRLARGRPALPLMARDKLACQTLQAVKQQHPCAWPRQRRQSDPVQACPQRTNSTYQGYEAGTTALPGKLPANFRNIRVIACHGPDTQVPRSFEPSGLNAAAAPHRGHKAFGQWFSSALATEGFQQPEVRAYHGLGTMLTMPEGYKQRQLQDDGDVVRQSTVHRVFKPEQ